MRIVIYRLVLVTSYTQLIFSFRIHAANSKGLGYEFLVNGNHRFSAGNGVCITFVVEYKEIFVVLGCYITYPHSVLVAEYSFVLHKTFLADEKNSSFIFVFYPYCTGR